MTFHFWFGGLGEAVCGDVVTSPDTDEPYAQTCLTQVLLHQVKAGTRYLA